MSFRNISDSESRLKLKYALYKNEIYVSLSNSTHMFRLLKFTFVLFIPGKLLFRPKRSF